MWEITLTSLLILAFGTGCAAGRRPKFDSHPDCRRKYPHTLLGEDYGLLTEEDLAISACIAKPEPFAVENFTPHPYWQCFSTRGSAFECDERDPDEGGRTAILAIVLKKDGAIHEYLSRRAISMDGCKAHAAEWARLTAGQGYVCVSGEFIIPRIGEPEKKHRTWIFASYKTAKGCDSYFEGGCSLAYQIKHGCDLAEMGGA